MVYQMQSTGVIYHYRAFQVDLVERSMVRHKWTNHCPIHGRNFHMFLCALEVSHRRTFGVEFVVSANWYYFASKSITQSLFRQRGGSIHLFSVYLAVFGGDSVTLAQQECANKIYSYRSTRRSCLALYFRLLCYPARCGDTQWTVEPMPILWLVWLMGRRKRRFGLYQCKAKWKWKKNARIKGRKYRQKCLVYIRFRPKSGCINRIHQEIIV